MADPNVTNGTHEPETPKPAHASLALTEYSANPSPKTSTTPKEKIKSAGVPEDYLLPNGYPDYLRLILTAKVYDVIETTPLTPAVNLSNRLESNVLLKREDLLPVFSFKLRGAYNKMAHLSEAERWKGVIACSAGNHAQGVAFSARKLRIPATITMPTGTPAIKHMNVSRMGGNVVLHGGDFDAAKAECGRLSAMHGLTNIPPFDDPYVIAGQGTIGAEILRQADLSKLEAIFCCVGGGGLIAGTGVYVKRIAPHVKIIGVETFDANALVTSLKAGKRVTLNDVGLFADGAAVKTVGEETFRICSEVVDDVIQVDTDDICAAIKDVFEDTRSILEPAGALSLAGLKKYVERNPSEDTRRQLVAVASGANMNFDRLRFVAERAAIGEKKEAILAVTIPERPGAFARLVAAVNPMNVTEFCYRYSNPGSADVLIGLSVSASTRQHDIKDLIERLEQDGMTARDLSGDELAKSHIRYLVGGRSNADNERLFAFEFPERGGALYKFLTTLQPGFNISLFHYRNYGGDVGKVLAGIQCPPGEEAGLEKFLHDIGYGYKEETDNETYKMFMRPS
ncbi:Threonine dehydratase [Hortaea werneckii]|uniref:Threonine dehydratase n=1 Tax=Hortaea werneckii EXF-2000 TaxID=1157616 RepID=A0A1Z5T8I7_HORWE|nr:Threonine dehydratase [Hortaea werneckii]OTA32171.1 Threonine dehydratase, mitochondrial [Hortaea werneckii EXF-2000]KAI6835925.1 Threonine dehydratase [Hortaea werneckii]KAI6844589.1 Threonine dehydratase [Hortaea werneckii]KAI6926656.1 Threonine dehydratase [Hortaea werneckii]